MRAVVKSITGFEEAFTSMFISKRNWTPELEDEIERICNSVLDKYGMLRQFQNGSDLNKFNDWLSMLLRMGKKHITVLRFIDVTIMTEGIHRAGQDDIDSHAKRFENKIIRSSTRLATFTDEMSDWYKDKIITTDTANGYIKEEYVNNNDVKRGLYMLSIPSNFISKINLCEWAHVFKERNRDGSANPEVKQWAEMVMAEITEFHNQITRDYVLTIEN